MSQLSLSLIDPVEPTAWWGELRHGGLLLSATALAGLIKPVLPDVTPRKFEHLRACLTPILANETPTPEALVRLVDLMLEDILGFATGWLKGKDLPATWGRKSMTGEVVKPRRLWQGRNGETLPVFILGPTATRLGVGRGRREAAKVVEWLRKAGQPLALVTNGRQWRIVYAGADFEAFTEWDAENWFEQGQPSAQLAGFRQVLRQPAALHTAILESRKGQAELSHALGERVRLAVELLIRAQSNALDEIRHEVEAREIYVAACRIVMRLVVVMFAEARDLLPRDNPRYHQSYGLEGIRDLLNRAGDPARRRHMHGAWPRLLALFRLIHGGSFHPDLIVPTYGGELFAPGEPTSQDGLSRALASLECTEDVDDQIVSEMLELLSRTRVRIRQGRQHTWVAAPVDFSDLSSEYIGILYEGLLDFELHRVADDPVLFLNLGTQPVLPLSRLESLDDKALKALVEAFRKGDKAASPGEADAAEDELGEATETEAAEEGDEDPAEVLEDEEGEVDGEDASGERRLTVDRARAWAERAVRVGKLVGARDLKDPGKVASAARALVARTVLPGEWYLVRWGGTRKGAGTFYTRPQLAVPTVMRTLRPLAYNEPSEAGGEWTPRPPEEILALKVCDPAMGSGSFLVAALRYLTIALHASLHIHGRIRAHGRKTLVTLGSGTKSSGRLSEETLPLPPDDPLFDDRLHAVLKRHIVENCIYGVDLDALAVELGRMALWVETMNKELPFGFLDHKLKVGNSLVGAWFNTFQQYPLGAWEREGGDKGHKGVHFEGEAWTNAIKAKRKEAKTENLVAAHGQLNVFRAATGEDAVGVHAEALAAIEKLHSVPVHQSERRARIYRDEICGNAAIEALRRAMDLWCALWFWPNDKLSHAPLPRSFGNPDPIVLEIVRAVTSTVQFFHWELEYPDVFARTSGGFDAVIGNPPWETQKPNSKEFFSNIDSLYRAYGKQEALQHQRLYFANDAQVENNWLAYNARIKAMGNWVKQVGAVQAKGLGFADSAHPFIHQGSADLNSYKLFVELAHALLRPDGQLGLVTPSGLYSDEGSSALRRLLFDRCRWHLLYVFQNERKFFRGVHHSQKQCVVFAQRGGRTLELPCLFRLGPSESPDANDIPDQILNSAPLTLSTRDVARFSPETLAILEIRSERDLEVLAKIYDDSVLISDRSADGWGLKYGREFDMTNDSKIFVARDKAEDAGYVSDAYGRWAKPDGMLLPLYEGRMIGQFDFSRKGWVSGKGRGAIWETLEWPDKPLRPQYLVRTTDCASNDFDLKVCFMDVSAAINNRTMIATVIDDLPCGHSAPILRCTDGNTERILAAAGYLNSMVFDSQLRQRVVGLHLTFNFLGACALPRPEKAQTRVISGLVARLSLAAERFAPHWLQFGDRAQSWRKQWAVTPYERIRLRCIIDAMVAAVYGLTRQDFHWILRDCDHPEEALANKSFCRNLDPKGFWRVDREKDPELRQTVLSLIAFEVLEKLIISYDGDLDASFAAFVALNDGEGWLPNEEIRLADYGLGHDDRAKSFQPVACRLGPRFLDWQINESPEESWKDCELHARAVLGGDRFESFMHELTQVPQSTQIVPPLGVGQLPLFGNF